MIYYLCLSMRLSFLKIIMIFFNSAFLLQSLAPRQCSVNANEWVDEVKVFVRFGFELVSPPQIRESLSLLSTAEWLPEPSLLEPSQHPLIFIIFLLMSGLGHAYRWRGSISVKFLRHNPQHFLREDALYKMYLAATELKLNIVFFSDSD